MNNTPAEKAKELIEKFRKELSWVENDFPVDLYRDAKACALICIDEIMSIQLDCGDEESTYEFWEKVKEEINKL